MKLFNRNNIKGGERAEMSFVDHLDALRGHLFKSAIAIVIGAIIMAIYSKPIIKNVLMGPVHSDFPTYKVLCKLSQAIGLKDKLCMEGVHLKMQSTAVSGQFHVYFNIILIGGFIIAFPYVFHQFWRFFKPALTSKELKNTRGVIFWVSLLFFLGVLFGYFVIAPYTINFFGNFTIDDDIQNIWTITSYFNTIVPLILGAGLAFQLPLVMYFLAKVGVVSAAFLRKGRRYAIVIMLVVSGIITPPDMLSQIVCALPLMLLYEISIMLCVRVEKKQQQENGLIEWQ